MTVPTPTFPVVDFDDGAKWTLVGGTTTAIDRFGSVKAIGDGSGDIARYLDTAPITVSSGSQHSLACWFKTTTTSQRVIMAQRNAPTTQTAWEMQLDASGRITTSFYSVTNASSGISSQTSGAFNDNILRHLLATVDGNDVNIHINGREVSSYNNQDNIIGSGFTGIAASGIANLSALGFFNASFELPGEITRIKGWEGTILTPAEVLEEFNNENGSNITEDLLLGLDSTSSIISGE